MILPGHDSGNRSVMAGRARWPQRAGLRLTVCGGALRTGAPYLPLSLRHYALRTLCPARATPGPASIASLRPDPGDVPIVSHSAGSMLSVRENYVTVSANSN